MPAPTPLPPCLLAADRIQRGASYLAHRLNGDGQGMAASAAVLGDDWEDAAYAFLELSTALVRRVADAEGREPAEVAAQMSVDATMLVGSFRSA